MGERPPYPKPCNSAMTHEVKRWVFLSPPRPESTEVVGAEVAIINTCRQCGSATWQFAPSPSFPLVSWLGRVFCLTPATIEHSRAPRHSSHWHSYHLSSSVSTNFKSVNNIEHRGGLGAWRIGSDQIGGVWEELGWWRRSLVCSSIFRWVTTVCVSFGRFL